MNTSRKQWKLSIPKLFRNTVLALILMNSLDALFTVITVFLFGIAGEANPFMKFLFLNCGIPVSIMFKLVAAPISLIPSFFWIHIAKQKNPKWENYVKIVLIIAFIPILIYYAWILAGHITLWSQARM